MCNIKTYIPVKKIIHANSMDTHLPCGRPASMLARSICDVGEARADTDAAYSFSKGFTASLSAKVA
jgi:hypothetical protein